MFLPFGTLSNRARGTHEHYIAVHARRGAASGGFHDGKT